MTLEIPGGALDYHNEDVVEAAIREMIEETGYIPLPHSKKKFLGKTATNPALFNNYCHSVIVGPVKKQKEQDLDHGEMIETVEVGIEAISKMILGGEIDHALMLDTFFFLLLEHKSSAHHLIEMLKPYSRPSL